MSWQIVHVTHESPEEEKQGVLRFWSGDYLWATRLRLQAPWGDETYGFVGAFDGGRCVGTTSYTISRRGQGILSQVFTDEAFRGQGIGTATVREAVETFRRHGARAVYLAAWREWVREIYRKVGFVRVGTMGERHAFKLTLDPSGEDENLFRAGQRTQVRRMEAGDQADLSALFNAGHPCVVKHYGLGCFLGSHFEGEFFTLRQQEGRPGFLAVALDGEETAVGFGTVMPSSRRHEGHTGILDLLIHPHYADMTDEVLKALEKGCGLERLWVYVGDSEQEKRRVFERAGYRQVAWLERQVKIETDYYGLTLYEKAVNRGS
ncbi:MAG: hypothetical protein A3F84_08235 [Candidatus Handelsmanbacteria bacterium RIFCSPLOWO2_12_FULL_64_10]|uniref:N-acetyltransferase domain-containing protein n=1 Tax=Handelsmanbacteria sp. (strain RIFCSPLOWO2_12_FULL_64_10) TaxID=1817868 RepID=A0A1F6CJ52_HANXR|nr:MAG: hypothetical protein A3F84_08235 [Candidatus Handelsmanbacteria bacterium RIFCSPLOWO2_12_FULL_64_10]